MANNILLTGGNGLLGRELRKYIECDAPSSRELDITNPKTFKRGYTTIIHCAAYTDVAGAEIHKRRCYEVNVVGTRNLINFYSPAYFVYISTEYAFNPLNFYTYTKLWGEDIVRQNKNSMIIRTLFKPYPFPFKRAFIDQYTTGDTVNIIAPMIADTVLSRHWGKIHLGTGRKTMFEMAKRSRPDVKPISVKDVQFVDIPLDYLT
jgi:dTDP-4-dehydrorhamnose reductase